ncbi:YfjI family protein [Paraburkholderia sp. A2RO-4L]|uniref:YfjI family protein n=1 Tax=Paraburkholderia sp. A2RO-4L TaxID=3028374 RepID=UPI003DA80B2C
MPITEYQDGPPVYQWPRWASYFSADNLPQLIGNAVREVSWNRKVPAELAAHAALGAVSLVCQNLINVKCPTHSPAPCSLFLWAISNSSGGKSLVEQCFLRAIAAFERKQQNDVAARIDVYRAELKMWEDDDRRLAREYRDANPDTEAWRSLRERRMLHEKSRPVAPSVCELRYAEVSPQGLRDVLATNSAIGILSAEAGPVVNGMTFSQPAALSGYWSGEDRPVALAGGSRRPDNPRLTVSVMLQDDVFKEFMKNRGDDAFGTGLLARFLFAFPVSVDWPNQQTSVVDAPEPALDRFNARVAEILNQPVPAPYERRVLKMSEDAKYYWKLFTETVNRELICGDYSDKIKRSFRKLGEQAARLAALFHYFDGEPGDISPDAMKRAIVLCEWYTQQFIQAFSTFAPSQQQQDNAAARELLEWLQKATANYGRYSRLTPGKYTERELANYSTIRNDSARLSTAIDVLEREGQIAIVPGTKGGRIVCYPPYMAQQFQQPNCYPPSVYPNRVPGYIAPSCMPPAWRLNKNNGQVNPADEPRYSSDPPASTVPLQFNNNQVSIQSGFGNCAPASDFRSESRRERVNVMELDTEEIRAVKQLLQKEADEAGIGPVSMSIRFHQG